jgi:hypothetical protein
MHGWVLHFLFWEVINKSLPYGVIIVLLSIAFFVTGPVAPRTPSFKLRLANTLPFT